MDLVERGEILRTLRKRFLEAVSGGQVVLVAGEAGAWWACPRPACCGRSRRAVNRCGGVPATRFNSRTPLRRCSTPARHAGARFAARLGVHPASEALSRRRRDADVRGLSRGARSSTREHPFGPTTRELQVLQLLCGGPRNAEIALHLSRSVRTVDHPLAAVSAKLGVDSRLAAIQAAQRAGLAVQSERLPGAK